MDISHFDRSSVKQSLKGDLLWNVLNGAFHCRGGSFLTNTDMDPMQVLPQELILHICSFLPVSDLLRMWELNYSWRQIVTDHSLWCDVTLVVTGYDEWELSEDAFSNVWSDVSHTLKVLRRAPFLDAIFFDGGNSLTHKQTQALLETKAVVLRIIGIFCSDDIENWTVKLIQHLGPHLEDVEVTFPSNIMMDTLNSLPRLMKLTVNGGAFRCTDVPLVQTPHFKGHLEVFTDTDHWGSWTLPPNVLVSVLKTHSNTLKKVVLHYGKITENLHHLMTLVLDDSKFKALEHLMEESSFWEAVSHLLPDLWDS